MSGLTKQKYIIFRLQEKDIIVQGNPRVYKELKDEMQKILVELQRMSDVIFDMGNPPETDCGKAVEFLS